MVFAPLLILLGKGDSAEGKNADYDPTDECFAIFHDRYVLIIIG